MCNAKQRECSSKSRLMTIEFNPSVSTTENKVPLVAGRTAIPPDRRPSRVGFKPAFGWESGRALELAAPRLKRALTSLPARPLGAVGAHKVLGACRHPYQHLPPLWQVRWPFTSPIRSKKLSRSAALPSDPRLWSNAAPYPRFLTRDIWVALGCVSRAHPCWEP